MSEFVGVFEFNKWIIVLYLKGCGLGWLCFAHHSILFDFLLRFAIYFISLIQLFLI